MFFSVPGGISTLFFTGNGYSAGLCGVMELPMASSLAHHVPAVILQHPQHLLDFHTHNLPNPGHGVKFLSYFYVYLHTHQVQPLLFLKWCDAQLLPASQPPA